MHLHGGVAFDLDVSAVRGGRRHRWLTRNLTPSRLSEGTAMDSNTFAVALIAVIALVICVVIWQIFATARARMHAADPEQLEGLEGQAATLDARLGALVDDVAALESRVSALEGTN